MNQSPNYIINLLLQEKLEEIFATLHTIHQRSTDILAQPIYRSIFGFHRYIGIGQYYRPPYVLTKRCYIPHTSRQLVQESTTKQVKTIILQQCQQVRFHKQTDKIDHGACVSCHRRNKKHHREVSQMLEATTCRCCVRINSRYTCGTFGSTKSLTGTYGAEVQSMPSLAQINLKKLA